jgi:hypothetical protein
MAAVTSLGGSSSQPTSSTRSAAPLGRLPALDTGGGASGIAATVPSGYPSSSLRSMYKPALAVSNSASLYA